MFHRASIFLRIMGLVAMPGILSLDAAAQPGSSVSHQRVMTWSAADGTTHPVLSPDQWETRRNQILSGFQEATGHLPSRDPIPDWAPRISEDVVVDGVRRITMTIVVEPGDRLPLDLYLPSTMTATVDSSHLFSGTFDPRLPTMVALHPTGSEGKRIVGGEGGRPGRQYGLELAQRGYVTICPDYPSFGDYDYDFGSDRYDSGTMKGIFNHMRCVDFLSALPFVDASRIGVIGHSLGGHNAMFLGMFDERIKVIVSSCGWTPFHDYYGGDIKGWTSERYMPRLRDVYDLDPDKVPFDFHEIVAALAPRTFVSVSPMHDSNFDVAGVRKAIPEANKVYSLLDADGELILLTPDCQHDFPTDMRLQSYAIIDRVLHHTPQQEIASDYKSELPRIAPLAPSETLNSFQVADGFEMQLTAAEPLVTDPVAMSFDADGRLYVVEMKDYSEQADDSLGQIRVLTDENGDGAYDSSVIFAATLSWPTAITCWDGGVFVGAAPDIIYLKDTDGDGKADQRDVVFTGFGRSNVQGLLNSFQWGPDNRIHGATSSAAGTVRCISKPDQPAVNLRSRDFSFDPRLLDLRPESGGAQHGACFDDWGNRFVCSNSDHAQAIIYDDGYLGRTAGVIAAPFRASIAVDGGQAEVFRISPVEPWRIVRTRLRLAGMVRGPVEGGGRAAGYFTGSTGITVYRGDAWPESMKGMLIVGDVGSNIIHRKRVESNGVSWSAHRIDDGFELVASSDNWFRPVQFANAPDGCLHVIDMYREVIEHPASLPPEIKPHLDLTSGRDRGRLYRICPTGFEGRKFTPLSKLTTAQLIDMLDHGNGWHRDTAQRLLFERQDTAAAATVKAKLTQDSSAVGWLHLLSVIDGWGALTESEVLKALQHEHPRVRERGVQLAERYPTSADVASRTAKLVQDDDARVRLQVALSLGNFPVDIRHDALVQLLQTDGADRWIRAAVFSSLGTDVFATWRRLINQDAVVGQIAVRELTALAARNASNDELATMADTVAQHSTAGSVQREILASIFGAQSKARRHVAFQKLLNDLISAAREDLSDSDASAQTRTNAVQNLSFSTFADDGERLLELLRSHEPPKTQLAVLSTLAKFSDPAIADALVDRWSSLSPSLRQASSQTLLSRVPWTMTLLQALTDGRLTAGTLSTSDLQRLADHPDKTLAALARSIVDATPVSSREQVIHDYKSALSLSGDFARGELAFRKHCSTCHRMRNIGFEVGPNLETLRNRGAETIVTNVLDPNREVNPAWRDYLVVTNEGTVLNGVIMAETATTLTLRRAEAKETTLLRTDIETMRDTGRSLMPEGLEKDVTPQTLADIITWIMTTD
jgi:putative membrane-bound dehydrogenase-like protein